MITLSSLPKNREHFAALWEFCEDVLAICSELDVAPVMNASLAVLAYSGEPELEVHDVDLSCPEASFAGIMAACAATDIDCVVQEWNVLELHRGALKVEFDGAEHWMQGLTGRTELFAHGSSTVAVVCRDDLATLYQRGIDAYEGRTEPAVLTRLDDLRYKLALVEST